MKYNEVKNQIEFDESSAIEGTYEIVVILRDDRYATTISYVPSMAEHMR